MRRDRNRDNPTGLGTTPVTLTVNALSFLGFEMSASSVPGVSEFAVLETK